jgi:hypothetical protein
MKGEVETRRKGRVKRALKSFGNWQTWQYLLVAAILLPLGLTLLRLDNLTMEEKRDAVLAADEADDPEQLRDTVKALRTWVFWHMNTSTGPFYLAAAYYRDAEAVIANATPADQNIYKAASEYCDPKFNYRWSWAYVDCMRDQLNQHAGSNDLADSLTARLPNPELYRREYLSPFWTPTPAGLVILVVAVLLLIVIVRIFTWLGLRIALAILKKNDKNA